MTTTSLTFDLYAKDHASATFDRFGRNVSSSSKSVGALKFSIGKLAGAFAGLAVIQKTTQFLSDSISEARESNKVSAQTAAVLKSTKGAANLTADAVGDLANKISLKAGIDDEAIQSGENLLLTFKNIHDEVGRGNKIFTRATKVAVDMSVAMGTDLKSANVLVGKALNDPIKGLTALTRVGVTFSEGQSEQIKKLVEQGKAMKAQKIILRELNSEFKGSAAAQADPADKAKVAWENLQETIGLKLMPILDKVLIWFTNDALPAVQRFGEELSQKLAPVIAQIVAFVQQKWPQIKQTFQDTLTDVQAVFSDFAELVTTIWQKWGDDIMRVAYRVFQIVSQVVKTSLHTVHGIIMIVTGLIQGDWSKVWDGVKEILRGAWDLIATIVKNAGATLLELLRAALDKLLGAAKNGISKLVGWFKSLPGKIRNAIGDLGRLLFDAGVQVIQGLLDGITSKIDDLKDVAGGVAGTIKDGVKGALGIFSPSKVMHGLGVNAMEGLIDGITSKIQSLRSAMKSVASTVSGLFGNPLLGENVNTVADIFRQQRGELAGANQLSSDIKKLLHKGLDMRFVQQLVETGNLTALHALATSSASDVQRFERGQRRLDRVTGGTADILNRGRQSRLDELQERRHEYRELLNRLEHAVKKGMDGARIVIDGNGNARLRIRQGSAA